eukprot:1107427-Rhodomonas_salina.2
MSGTDLAYCYALRGTDAKVSCQLELDELLWFLATEGDTDMIPQVIAQRCDTEGSHGMIQQVIVQVYSRDVRRDVRLVMIQQVIA